MTPVREKKTPQSLTRADIEQIAAEADARIGRVARKVQGLLILVALALAVVVAATLYLGLIAIASILIAVCLVTVTLYLFVRLWPGARPLETRPPQLPEPAPALPTPSAPRDLPRESRFRVLWALREVAKRQDGFQISGRAAERFARTVRFLLKADTRR